MSDLEFAAVCQRHVGEGPGFLRRVERALVRGAMQFARGDQTCAATALGVSPRVLNYALMQVGERPVDKGLRKRVPFKPRKKRAAA